MKVRRATRGQPLVALVLILGGWIGARALLWDSPLFMPGTSPMTVSADVVPFPIAEAPGPPRSPGADESAESPPSVKDPARGSDFLPSLRSWPAFRPAPTLPPDHPTRLPSAVAISPQSGSPPIAAAPAAGPGDVPVGVAAAHQMMRIAMLQVPFPMAMALPISVPISERAVVMVAPQTQPQPAGARPSRWSGDGWLLLREGGDASLASGPAPAAYGASQAGAVLRYRLAPTSRHHPSAYLRGTAALNGSREKDVALGLSARPFAGVPVTVQAELRATDQRGGTRLRPAVLAVTELPPFELPHKLRAEAYAQAGYVDGRNATAFADGQLRVDHRVVAFGRGELRAGAGAWGGVQKGTSRLDVGPAATMGMGLGDSASARVAVDWRFRIAGDAKPASGPALTLSAGF